VSSVFLSYSSADRESAVRIRDLLVGHGYGSVFRDKDPDAGIPGGADWAHELFANLQRSDIVVFFGTPRSLESKWCHTELAVAVAQGKYVVQISVAAVPSHSVLADRQSIGPIPDLAALVDRLVTALSRVGYPPGDPFTWDPDRSPYPGLQRLTEDYAAVLFGRDREIGTILERLARPQPHPILVVGPSGSGKSSLVRAGVLPRLKLQEGTIVLPVVEPGGDPLRRVALAFEAVDQKILAAQTLADDKGIAVAVDQLVATRGARVVLVLDQAEDLLSRGARLDAHALANRLAAVDRDRLEILVLVRSASLDAWLRDAPLAALTPSDPVWVRPLDRSGMREVIVGPARVAGVRFEPPELVERILEDTGDGQALPLLAALLEELTETHSRLTPAIVTSELYDRIGPVGRVVERRARAATDDIKADLEAPESAAVEAYLRLVEIDDDGQPVRAEVAVEGLPEDVLAIIAMFERHRLVIRDRRVLAGSMSATTASASPPTAEVVTPVHEEVFRAWPALAAAIAARRTDLQTRTWLRRDARSWVTSGRGQVPLTGGRLGLAVDWYERNPADVSDEVRAYLNAAVRQRRRRLVLAVATPVLALVVIVVGALAIQAIRARSDADALRLSADARANFDTRLDLGLLLALEAKARSDDLQVQAMPLVGLTRGPGPRRILDVGASIESAALDLTGSRAVVDVGDRTLLWDVEAGRAAGTLPGPADAVAISADGSTVAVAGPARIDISSWPGDTPAIRTTCPVPGPPIEHVRLSETGDRAVVVAVDRQASEANSAATVIRLQDCSETPLDLVSGLVVAIDIDAATDRVALGTESAGAGVWALSNGQAYEALPSDHTRVVAVALGPDDMLAGMTPDGKLLLWNTRTGTLETEIQVYDNTPGVAVRFWPGHGTWVTGSNDGDLRVVNPAAPLPVGPSVRGLPRLDYRGNVESLDLAATDEGAVTVDPSGRLVTWDLVGRPPLGDELLADQKINLIRSLSDGSVVAAGPGSVWMLDSAGQTTAEVTVVAPTALAVDGTNWIVGTKSGEVLVGSEAGGAPRMIDNGADEVAGVAALPGGSVAAIRSTTADGSITVITGSGEKQQRGLAFVPRSVATNGRWLFVGAMDGNLWVLDPTDLSRDVATVKGHATDVFTIEVAPDGSTIATGSDDRSIVVWDVDGAGQPTTRQEFTGHGDRVTSLAFSPDGRWLASAGEDHFVGLWDLPSKVQIGDAIAVPGIPVLAFAAGKDVRLLVADEGIERWAMGTEAWAQAACTIIGGRTLSSQERDRYLGGESARARCPSP
jgi:WD40 repeat protein